MINYNISLNKELAQIVEKNIKLGKYANRSEFFREMIRKMFVFGTVEEKPSSYFSKAIKESENDFEKKDFHVFDNEKKALDFIDKL